MDYLSIKGQTPLQGTININGAKNAALPLIVCGLLTSEDLVLHNVPRVSDIHTMASLLGHMGATITWQNKTLTISAPHNLQKLRAPYEMVKTMRASIMVLGALLARFGHAEVSLPGGCAIGVRPIDFHLEGLRALGVQIDLEDGYVVARAPKGVRGGSYTFPKPSVTGTLNLMFAAVFAQDSVTLHNVAQEPEIDDVIQCLVSMGAYIVRQDSTSLFIKGVSTLRGTVHTVICDRIEIGTYMVAAAITGGQITLCQAQTYLLPGVIPLLESCGVNFHRKTDDTIVVTGPKEIAPFFYETGPYPGLPTDLQAQFMALACIAKGESTIVENIWENRFMHVAELARMGANIHLSCDPRKAIIHGVSQLNGAKVMATDLRASVALVLAGLAAKGCTSVSRIYHLDRGYENLEGRLIACGASVERLTE